MKSQTCLHEQQAAALLIVLAFVVILVGLAVAYLSRTTTDRTVAHSSFNDSSANQLAESATNIVIGDLRQEIINGSTAVAISPTPSAGPSTVYAPTQKAYMVPARSGNPSGSPDPIPNLVRRSVNNDPLANPGLGSRASAVNSTTDSSANGHYVTLARWNKHYLIPRHDQSDTTTDTTPISPVASPLGPGDATGFTPPDWVIVKRSGPNQITAWSSTLADSTPGNDNYVLGRYAYAVYDEGGLLDVNVAGYPNPSSTPSTYVTDVGRKGVLAFADLTSLPTSTASPAPTFPPERVNSIVGWRNFATTQQPSSSPFPNNFSFTAATTSLYDQYVLSNTNGFMTVSTSVWSKPGSNPNPRTDELFVNRQQLVSFRNSTGAPPFSQNALQYMGTFSRETTANGPQWNPAVPTTVNPNFQTLWVNNSFARNDGTTANPGENLVKKRFLLQRLNWLTYKGPSGPSLANPTGRAVTDPDIAILLNNGITSAFLQQGTDANILKYFGLAWDQTKERWNYVGHGGSTTPIGSLASLASLISTREPDFFELLQAGLYNGSLGDSSGSPGAPPTPTPSPTPTPTATPTPTPIPNSALPITHQQSKMLQLLTIGANLITQARTDSYPTRIACLVNDVPGLSPTEMEAIGSPRLPYLNGLAACPVGTTGNTGGIHWFLVPNLWNPFRNNWDLTETTSSTPLYPRPPVRIRVTGSVAFGSIPASPTPTPPATGRAVSVASVTTFPSSTISFTDLILTLKTGTTTGNAFGRDGLREASRMSTSDISTTLTAFTTTSSPAAATATWSNIARPPRPDNSLPGTTNFIVFRLSLPGSTIPLTADNPLQNPVLILNPGFQMTLDYQSTNGTWYPYSFLQGNSATSTWISSSLALSTTLSQYGLNPAPPGSSPTLLSSGAVTLWTMTTLAQAPMFAKADPRSIRYNAQIGVVSLPTANPSPTPSAGIIDSIWPNNYATVPQMSPDLNPATYSQRADNGPSGSNPFNEVTTKGDPFRPIVMNRPFRSVGEMAYAFRDQPFKTLDFSSSNTSDAALLDLFTVNDYSDPSSKRAGVISLNTRQAPVLTAALSKTIVAEGIAGAAAPSPSPITNTAATNAAKSLALSPSATPALNKGDLTTLIANETGLGPTVPKTQRESIARALGEISQSRTWNLMIDVIAQAGRYPQNAASGPNTTNPFANFIVEGEQHYWVHVAIDRFTGQVIDKQIEVVNE